MDEEAVQVINTAFENLRSLILQDQSITKVEFDMTFSDISDEYASQTAYYPHIILRVERTPAQG